MELSRCVRTDFTCATDQWEELCTLLVKPSEPDGFIANLAFINDISFDALSPAAVAQSLRNIGCNQACAFIADAVTFSSPLKSVVCIELIHPDYDANDEVVVLHDAHPRLFRVVPSAVHVVENNLSIANCDWEDFAGEEGGMDMVYRG